VQSSLRRLFLPLQVGGWLGSGVRSVCPLSFAKCGRLGQCYVQRVSVPKLQQYAVCRRNDSLTNMALAD